jgi:hypothetical protein
MLVVSISSRHGTDFEVGVAVAICWCIAIQSTDEARQDTELLSGIVTHHADLDTDLCEVGVQF